MNYLLLTCLSYKTRQQKSDFQYFKNLIFVGLLSLSLLLSNSVISEIHEEKGSVTLDSQPEISPVALEKVLISSSKNPTLREDYPGAITILDENKLTDFYLSSVVDVSSLVPGLFVQETGARNPSPVIMRGINLDGMSTNNLGGDTYTVASYFDNIPLQGYYAPPQVILKDLNSVEVLRGPQGTLYGASSLGGVIAHNTNKPIMNELSFSVHGRISRTRGGDDTNTDTDLVVNLPIAENILAMRGLASFTDSAGFIDNDTLLSGPEEGINKDEVTAGRLSFLLTPADRLAISLMLQKQQTKSGDFQADNPSVTEKHYKASTFFLQPMEGDLNLADLEVQYRFKNITMELTGNHYEYDLEQTTDITAFYQFQGYTVGEDGGDNGFTEADVEVVQSNFEIRAITQFDSSANGIIGFSSTENKVDFSSEDNLTDFPESFRLVEYTYTQAQTLKDKALFGELNWQTTEDILLTVGGRYFDYKDTAQSCDAFYTDSLFCMSEKIESAHSSFKLAGLYQYSDNTAFFLNVAEGFRRGGANAVPQDLAANSTYNPDTTINYELGILGQSSDGRLDVSMTLFYIDWSNIQLFTGNVSTDLGYYVNYIANAKDAESAGIELEVDVSFGDDFQLKGFYAYSDAKLSSDALSYNDDAGSGDDGFKDDRLPGTPNQQARLSLSYKKNWEAYTFDARISSNYVGDVNTQLNKKHSGFENLGGYTLHYMNIGLSKNQWRLGMFTDNVTNKRAVTAKARELYGPGSGLSYVVKPRTIGLDARYTF